MSEISASFHPQKLIVTLQSQIILPFWDFIRYQVKCFCVFRGINSEIFMIKRENSLDILFFGQGNNRCVCKIYWQVIILLKQLMNTVNLTCISMPNVNPTRFNKIKTEILGN